MAVRTIVFLGMKRSGSLREAVTAAAKRLKLNTVVLTDRRSFVRDQQQFPDVHRMIYVEKWDYELLKGIIRSLESEGMWIEGIVSLMDPLVSLAAALAEEFGLNRLTLSAVEAMEDKIQTRKALRHTSYNPAFQICYPDDYSSEIIASMLKYLPVVIGCPGFNRIERRAPSTGSQTV